MKLDFRFLQKKRRLFPFYALASALLFSTASIAQQSAPVARIVGPIDESQLITLKGNTHPSANSKDDRGPVSSSLPMPDLTLVLSRSAEQQATFESYVSSEYEASSSHYHQWLTPDQIGAQFGPAPTDIATISNWLSGHGFAITKIAKDGMSIRFSGTAGQVETAFHTQIHNLSVNGVPHIGNMSDPQIPTALASVVVGVKALHNFLPHPLHKTAGSVEFNKEVGKWQRTLPAVPPDSTPVNAIRTMAAASPHPLFGINVPSNASQGESAYLEEDVAPYDFATIYNVLPLWNSNVTGTGQTIAIAGTSDINLNDVATFRSAFGLPAGLTPQEVDTNGLATQCTSTSATAVCGIGDLEENSIDVEWSSAVAPGAQVVLVVTGQNTAGTVDSVYDSAEYVVENLTAKILSVSYGECELGQGTAGNVSYYNLWQSAAAEGIAVFVATGDAGSPSCDDGNDEYYGNPYSAQYGLSVNGIASTPYNTAVGGTDFSWCKPTINSSGNVTGCPTTSSGASPYWNASNSATTGESAAGYIPEIPWNDTCTNPINASYVESVASYLGGTGVSNAEASCNFIQNNWSQIYQQYGVLLAPYVDTVGGSGGASNCVVNDGQNVSSCTNSTTNTGSNYGSIPLTNDGWVKPSWQAGVTGIPSDGVRDIPDVSFFAGDGALDTAYLFCVSNSNVGTCTYSDTSENFAEEGGGTSFATPAMAGVMALINQKSGASQGLPNSQLYELATKQDYSDCSAENVKTSSACYFNDVDQGTNTMPCDLGAPIGGITYENGNWASTPEYPGTVSPNCTALNAGDQVGTLTNSSGSAAYNAVTGFDLATGLGSLNVSNVVNAWSSDAGTAPATMTVSLSATSISASSALTVTVTVTGSGSLGTPTGSVVLSGGGYTTTQTLSSGAATITIPANSLTAGSDTLTVTYGGDSNYASITQTATVVVSVVTPTVTVTAPASANVANALTVTVTVSGPSGAAVPTGTVSLVGGGYTSGAVTLSASGIGTFTIPANTLAAGTDTLTATYSGNSNYAGTIGSATVTVVQGTTAAPTITVTPASGTVDSGQSLGVTVTVSGAAGTPTGTATLKAGSYTSSATQLSGSGGATFTIPANSLTAGTATLTVTYSGNAIYASGSGSATVTVTQSAYTLAATTPAAIAPGSSTSSTVTVTSTTGYNGTITLTCTATSGPANALYVPTCAAGSTVAVANGVASGTANLTITTTGSTAQLHPTLGNGGWMGAGGAALAFLAFLGFPGRRRRSWQSLVGLLAVLVALASLSACGSSNTVVLETTPGTYTFTVQGQGNDPASTSTTTTFTLTVN
jgi:hypothetical protein